MNVIEKDILRFLEEKAADSGLKNVRLLIENASKFPCACYVNLSDKGGPTAIDHAKSRLASAHEVERTRSGVSCG